MKGRIVLALMCIVASLALSSVALAQETELTIGTITGDAASYYGQQVTLEGNVDEMVNIRSFLLGEGGLTNPQLLVLNNTGEEFNIGLTQGARVRVTATIYPSYNQGGWDQVMTALPAEPIPEDTGAAGGETTMTEEAAGAGGELATEEAGGDMLATEEAGGELATEEAGMATPAPVEETGAQDTAAAGEMPEEAEAVTLADFPVVILTDRFPDHTLFVVDSIDAIEFVIIEEATATDLLVPTEPVLQP